MEFRKGAALGIVAVLLLAGCPSCSSKKNVAEKVGVTEETAAQIEETTAQAEAAAEEPAEETTTAVQESSYSRKIADFLNNEFEVDMTDDSREYSTNAFAGPVILCQEGMDCSEACMVAEHVADTNGLFYGLQSTEWRFFDVSSMTQYSKQESSVVKGELCMHYETVTVYEYTGALEAKAVFSNIMAAYETAGVDLDVLTENEYKFTDTEGYFIVSFSLVDQLLQDGGGETDTLFREFTTFEAFYFIENKLIRLTYTDTSGDCELMKAVIAELGIKDPFTVKSSKEVLDSITVHIT